MAPIQYLVVAAALLAGSLTAASAQDASIRDKIVARVDFYDADIEEVLNYLQDKTGVRFVLRPSEPTYDRVSLGLSNRPLDYVLKRVCKQGGAIARWVDDHYVVEPLRDGHGHTRRGLKILPPPAKLSPDEPAENPAVSKRIAGLITELASISDPDYGLSPTMSGHAFAPIEGSESAGAFVLTNHRLKRSNAFVDLVKAGPAALPLLLKHLDDPTPTQLKVTNGFGSGLLRGHEVDFSPANELESKLLRNRNRIGERVHSQSSYVVKVGDVCFVAIGQIVGRRYLAVRYQPTGIVIINSPVEDKAIASEVRAIWSSATPTKHLFDSLLRDYSTRVEENDESLDGDWSTAAELQYPSALRLLYYFPKQTSDLIAGRLAGLDARGNPHGAGTPAAPGELDTYIKRCMVNGLRADDFVKAVAWCKEPPIRRELLSVFRRTTDPDLLIHCLPSLNPSEWPLVHERFSELLARQPKNERGWYGDGYNSLVALYKFAGEKAKPFFKTYSERASPQRCISMCEALRHTRGEWDNEMLVPLLSDKRASDGYSHAVSKKSDERLPIRVCDKAAATICVHRRDLKFEMVGTDAELDAQIIKMSEKLSHP